MSNIKINKDFLGFKNKDGFNYPISENKIAIIVQAKNNHIKKLNQINFFILLYFIILIFVNFFILNFQIIHHNLYFYIMTLPIAFLMYKRPNRWNLIWFDFLLERNHELLSNKNSSKQQWDKIFF